MADSKREIERKFEFAPGKAGKGEKPGKRAKAGAGPLPLPDLTGTAGIAEVRDRGTVHLDAVYYDTPDRRLAADGLTLRRRTGGDDAGWHLKLPVSPGIREEVHAPLSDAVPHDLAALVRSRVRGAALEPLVRLRSERHLRDLLDGDGNPLAELCTDAVRAERGEAVATWTEVEVELADGTAGADGDPAGEETGTALLDTIGKKFLKAGLRASDAPSKLARALAETDAGAGAGADADADADADAETGTGAETDAEPPEGTAAAYVLAYLREQRDVIVALDPAVRRDLPDSVHQMRVAVRRTRSAFKTHRKVLDRTVTDPLGEELKWLGGELGVDRDREVLRERFRTHIRELPRDLVVGPVRGRLRTWNETRRRDSRRRALAALDSPRHISLLDALDALLAGPPLLKAADRPAESVLPKAVLHDYDRLAERVGHALELAPGHERDLALHEARKAAKRARYAAEAAVPALGKPAKHQAKAMKKVQTLLGGHQDSVVARAALRGLADQAAGAGEPSFTWGVLYAREEALAQRQEDELPGVWAKAADPRLRAALK
ncbi:CYTH and CHAD domain-containing protein [Streptomyces sp. NPDC006512]|uniref:CYTH and CHAD domain-containing protein n=1 Tax=Streptomyces sp. NPDC006512 TaxID=3154307 RepID=UPI0033A2AAF5